MAEDMPLMDVTERSKLVAWVVSYVMPHEPAVRAWLRSRMIAEADIDDLIQEAYAKFSALKSAQHIERTDAFFFQTVRNLLIDQVRHSRVVRLDAVADIESLSAHSDAPTPERILQTRIELERLSKAVRGLPDRCRRIFTMRKVEGMSQREIAAALGVSESIVENDCVKALRTVMKEMREEVEDAQAARKVRDDGREEDRKRD